jgi:hypothetical protein
MSLLGWFNFASTVSESESENYIPWDETMDEKRIESGSGVFGISRLNDPINPPNVDEEKEELVLRDNIDWRTNPEQVALETFLSTEEIEALSEENRDLIQDFATGLNFLLKSKGQINDYVFSDVLWRD